MKLMKKIFAAAMMLSIAGFAAADDWDDFGSDSGAAEPSVAISGAAELAGRIYTDQIREPEVKDVKEMPTEGLYSAKLNFDYSGASSDVSFKLKFNNNSLGGYTEDILDEFTARAYLGNLQIEAGKMKTVWGKGDKIHVVDNFNANDYTDFVFPDYIDRRLAEPMFRMVYSTNSNIKFEGIWTPMMTVDRLATGGIWQPAASKALTELVEGIVGYNLALDVAAATGASDPARLPTAIGAVSSIMEASSFTSDDLVADNIHSLRYGQAGARTTFTLGGLDLGASYYYGHYKQPTADLSPYINGITSAVKDYVTDQLTKYATSGSSDFTTMYGTEINDIVTEKYGAAIAAGTITAQQAFMLAASEVATANAEDIFILTGEKYELPSLNYDQLQVFGLEAAFVLWKFNMRAEGAYYLTEDTAGDNPWIKNNSVQWVAGFDMDMPWTNMNLNVQTQGKYILKNDKITNEHDTDYNSDDKYISNKVIVDVTDSYAHDSIKIDIKGILEVETLDFVVMPSLTIKAVDDFTITAAGMWIKTDNENSEFYNFRRNSFAQISCKYLF